MKKKKNKKLIEKLKSNKKHSKDLYDSTFSIVEVLIIILISILFGIIIGYIITCSKSPLSTKDKNLKEIVDVYDSLTTGYYDKVDKSKLSDAAIKGMIESTEDPYTNYMDEDITKDFNETISGSFTGIGVTVMYEEGYYKIIDIMKNSPASKSDLEKDDIIVKVDDKDLKEDVNAFKNISNGKAGSKVKLTIRRGEETKELVLKRAIIEIESVHNHIFDYEDLSIGYVKIDSFASNSYKQFKKAIDRFDKKKVDALVIDVRDNPGGQLEQTREILSLFFPKKTVLYQVETKNVKRKVHSLNSITKKYPIAVLTNNGSASAAEILASCFKDNYRDAVIVGTTTYGKGTVQKQQALNSGNSIKYTTEKWLTSKGKWLDAKGVTPDVKVEGSPEYYENPVYKNDNQLHEALKRLKESN